MLRRRGVEGTGTQNQLVGTLAADQPREGVRAAEFEDQTEADERGQKEASSPA